MRRAKSFVWLLLALGLVGGSAFAQDFRITEGNLKRGQPLAHSPGSWLSMTGGQYVSSAYAWNAEKKRYEIRNDITIDNLPSAIKLDLAMARERAKASGRTPTYGSLKEEIEKSVNVSRYYVNNQYISSDRRDLYKNIHDTDEFGWWGHCNGEAAASLYEKVPTADTEIHGIKFSPNDFKELYTLGYSGEFPTEFAGERSNISSSVYERAKGLMAKPDDPNYIPEMKKLYKEAFYVDPPESWEAKHFTSLFGQQVKAFDDMPPADFYRMITKSVDSGTGLVFDRSPGNVVWNYPASGYEHDAKKNGTKVVDGKTLDVYNMTTKVQYGDYSDYSWSGGGGYTYDLYVDPATGKVEGGEWTGSSVTDHPDFAWKPEKSLKDVQKDKAWGAKMRKAKRDSLTIERYLAAEFKKKGWNDLAERIKAGDYVYVMSELKTKKESQLLQYVNYLSDLQNEIAYANTYNFARTLQDKYAAPPPAPTPANTGGPGATERLDNAAGTGTPATGGTPVNGGTPR